MLQIQRAARAKTQKQQWEGEEQDQGAATRCWWYFRIPWREPFNLEKKLYSKTSSAELQLIWLNAGGKPKCRGWFWEWIPAIRRSSGGPQSKIGKTMTMMIMVVFVMLMMTMMLMMVMTVKSLIYFWCTCSGFDLNFPQQLLFDLQLCRLHRCGDLSSSSNTSRWTWWMVDGSDTHLGFRTFETC